MDGGLISHSSSLRVVVRLDKRLNPKLLLMALTSLYVCVCLFLMSGLASCLDTLSLVCVLRALSGQ